MRAALLIAIAACSYPVKQADGDGGTVFMDAPDPLGCFGKPFGTTAPAKISITGLAEDFGTGVKDVGSQVVGQTASADIFYMATTDSNGSFGQTITTNGKAQDGYIMSVGSPYVPSFYYPSHPFNADTVVALPVLTQSELTQIQNPPGTAFGEFVLGDCDNRPLVGCTLTISPAATLIDYPIAGNLSNEGSSTDSTGAAIVFGLKEGTNTFTASCASPPSLRSVTLAIEPEATYFIRMQP